MSTEPGREFARAVARAEQQAAQPRKAPARPLHLVSLPLSVLDTATRLLRDTPQRLYLHLWVQVRRHCPNPDRRWLYHEDRRLIRALGTSEASLNRARAELRNHELITTTTNQGHKGRVTMYLLTWPVPLPDSCPVQIAPLYLDELAAYGHPPEGLAAWIMLAEQHGAAPPLALAYAARPTWHNYQALRSADPWLTAQLIWADPARYREFSAARTQSALPGLV